MKRFLTVLSLTTGLYLAGATGAFANDAKDASEFVQKAAMGNQFEIATSKLALEKSQSQDVKTFAQKMIDDHTEANNNLKAVLPESTVKTASTEVTLDKKHQKMYDELKEKPASKFDDEYVDVQQKAHKEAVALFKDYADDGKDAALKNFASKTLPALEQHKENVEQLDKAH